ncbi:hypothetical protein FF2_046047 [Malus domestica]
MQDIKCEQKNVAGNASSASVSTMFRMRYGLKNMTFAAEGIWKSTSRQLCMAGCLGLVDVDGSLCNSRICLYVPISFFIKERNIFMEVYPAPITVVCIASAAYRDVELFKNLSSKLQCWNCHQEIIVEFSQTGRYRVFSNQPFSSLKDLTFTSLHFSIQPNIFSVTDI